MSSAKQVRSIIATYERLKGEHKIAEFFIKYPPASKVYNAYFVEPSSEYRVSALLFPEKGQRDRPRREVRPTVSIYTQVFEQLKWVQKERTIIDVTRKNGSKYRLPSTVYFAQLKPFYEYLRYEIHNDLATKAGNQFLISFFDKSAIRKLTTSRGQHIISGCTTLLREYLVFRLFLENYARQPNWKQTIRKALENASVAKEPEKDAAKARKIEESYLLPVLHADLYLEFFSLYLNEKEAWTTEENGFDETAHQQWWTLLEQTLHDGNADPTKFHKITRLLNKTSGGGTR